MPTDGERKALWFLSLVALSGAGVRMWRGADRPPDLAAAQAIDAQLKRADSAADVRSAPREKRGEGRSRGRTKQGQPAGPNEATTPAGAPAAAAAGPVDLDRANATEIETLPWIGPALAERIVANRDSAGPFGGIEALCDVRGIGRVLAEKLRPLVTFSGPRRPVSDGCDEASSTGRKRSAARRRESS